VELCRNKVVYLKAAISYDVEHTAMKFREQTKALVENGLSQQIDPIIRGLLARLPEPGEVWPEVDRGVWLDLLRGTFKLLYKDEPARMPSASLVLAEARRQDMARAPIRGSEVSHQASGTPAPLTADPERR
jgi:hypothetical protein